MTARYVYWMNVSLDLRIEREPNEQGQGDWPRISEQLHREFNARAGAMTALVEGRIIYETMEAAWPAARHDESLPDFLREFGEIWTDKPKVMVSRTRTEAQHHTEIVAEDAMAQLAQLREQADGDLGVGGATLASQMLDAGLLDELLLFVHPVILGEGRSLFDPPGRHVDLELLEHASFDLGVIMQRYAVRSVHPATQAATP